MTAEGASGATALVMLDAPRDADTETRTDPRSFSAWQCGIAVEDGEVRCDVAPELIVELL
jgi:hypothetical protein